MIPVHIRVGHYRALRDIDVPLSSYTALVGPNGVGKSTILNALDFFLDRDRGIEGDDVQRGCDDDVSITVAFGGLTAEEYEQYEDSLDDDDRLVVTKVCRLGNPPRYEILGMRHEGFDALRELAVTGSKTDFNNAFKVFVAEGHYDISVKRSADDNLAELRRWESEHLDQCVEAPVPFEFEGSGKEQLIPTLRSVYVPAVQDASVTFGDGRSPLTQMIRALVFPRFESNERFVKLREHVAEEYQSMFPSEGTPELAEIAERITTALEAFCPGSAVQLGWAANAPQLSIPPVLPKVVEDGVATDIEHKGHGLQRGLIIAMLQAEDEYRRSVSSTSPPTETNVVLMIEEPELFQHPTQCRHFRKVLSSLSTQTGQGSLRVLVTTHSPDFVSLEGIDAIRIMRRSGDGSGVPQRKIASTTLEAIAKRYSEITKKAIDTAQLSRRLHVADNVMREAFFSNAVALVEGDGDYGLLSAQCDIEGYDLEGQGIVVIPCDGKSNMPLAVAILEMLGISYYALFDSDSDTEQNAPLLRALGMPEKDIPKTGVPDTAIHETYAVFRPKVETVVRNDFKATIFDSALAAVATEFDRAPKQILKNPVTARELLVHLRDEKKATSKILHDISGKIAALH